MSNPRMLVYGRNVSQKREEKNLGTVMKFQNCKVEHDAYNVMKNTFLYEDSMHVLISVLSLSHDSYVITQEMNLFITTQKTLLNYAGRLRACKFDRVSHASSRSMP